MRTKRSKPHWSEIPPISQKELTKMKLKGDRVSELAIKILIGIERLYKLK